MILISTTNLALLCFAFFAIGVCSVCFILLGIYSNPTNPTKEQIDSACAKMNPGFPLWHNDTVKERERAYAVKWLNAWEETLKH